MAEQKITDLAYLYEISMGDLALAQEMIMLFLENAPVSIQKLKRLTDRKDWTGVAAEAHKFKPNLAYMGLNTTTEMMEKLEKSAREEKDSDTIPYLIGRIEQACKQACEELKTELKNLRG